MTTYRIPTIPGVPFFSQRSTLDGIDYEIVMQWNARSGRWGFSLYTDGGAPIVQGVSVVTGWDLLSGVVRSDGVPPGMIVALDSSQANADATLSTLGVSVDLWYVDGDEAGAA